VVELQRDEMAAPEVGVELGHQNIVGAAALLGRDMMAVMDITTYLTFPGSQAAVAAAPALQVLTVRVTKAATEARG
jgi:hypothetical protein